MGRGIFNGNKTYLNLDLHLTQRRLNDLDSYPQTRPEEREMCIGDWYGQDRYR